MNKEKIVVYGKGKQYENDKEYIEDEYEIVGFIDQKSGDISIKELSNIEYDKIYIGSLNFEEEIRAELKKEGYEGENIITSLDTWWGNSNGNVHDNWIIKKISEIEPGKTILDAGAGEERFKKYCAHLNYISQDFGEYDETEKNANTGLHPKNWESKKCDIISDIISIPMPDKSVDVILCSEVFEHIADPILAVKEFSRLLKQNGILILTAPNCSLTHFAPFYFCNGFSRYWYEENLKKNGFEIIEMKENGDYFSYLKQEMMRVGMMSEKYSNPVDKRKLIDTIKLMNDLSKSQNGSQEVLCFGRMVLARLESCTIKTQE